MLSHGVCRRVGEKCFVGFILFGMNEGINRSLVISCFLIGNIYGFCINTVSVCNQKTDNDPSGTIEYVNFCCSIEVELAEVAGVFTP